jgi:hypothetical protein
VFYSKILKDKWPDAFDKNRLVFTIGKYAVNDIFDANKRAHDPTRDFSEFSALVTLWPPSIMRLTPGATHMAQLQNGSRTGGQSERAWRSQLPEVPGGQKIEPVVCFAMYGCG